MYIYNNKIIYQKLCFKLTISFPQFKLYTKIIIVNVMSMNMIRSNNISLYTLNLIYTISREPILNLICNKFECLLQSLHNNYTCSAQVVAISVRLTEQWLSLPRTQIILLRLWTNNTGNANFWS